MSETQSSAPASVQESSAPVENSEASNTENSSTDSMSLDGSSPEALDQAVAEGEITKKQANELKKKYQLKVDGKDEELELDLANEDEVKKHLQKSKSFDKRSKEFAGFKSQVEQFIQKLKSAPDSVLADMGIDVDDFAEKRIQRKIEEMSKSPEQLEREKMQAELEQLRREKEEAAKAREEAEQESMLQQSVAEIQNGIMAAMEETNTILPKRNTKVIGWIGQAMKMAMERGHNEVTVKDVIPIVEKRYKQELKELFDVLPEDAIEALVGNNNLDRLRKKRIAKAPPMTARNVTSDTGSSSRSQAASSQENTKDQKKMSYTDFFKR
jgi:hypothetical protein